MLNTNELKYELALMQGIKTNIEKPERLNLSSLSYRYRYRYRYYH